MSASRDDGEYGREERWKWPLRDEDDDDGLRLRRWRRGGGDEGDELVDEEAESETSIGGGASCGDMSYEKGVCGAEESGII